MLNRVINRKFTFLLILSVFCFSSGTLGGYLLHGHEIHIVNNHTHFHHINGHNGLDDDHNEEHGLGGSDHHDAGNIMYHDFLPTNHTRIIKPYSENGKQLHTSFARADCQSLLCATARSAYSSNINQFPSTNLYLLNSSVLI